MVCAPGTACFLNALVQYRNEETSRVVAHAAALLRAALLWRGFGGW